MLDTHPQRNHAAGRPVVRQYVFQTSAMVTSTSTPGSMEMLVICFTTSAGLCRSISRLWILRSRHKGDKMYIKHDESDAQLGIRSTTRKAQTHKHLKTLLCGIPAVQAEVSAEANAAGSRSMQQVGS